jgi:hypothetical protein
MRPSPLGLRRRLAQHEPDDQRGDWQRAREPAAHAYFAWNPPWAGAHTIAHTPVSAIAETRGAAED